ncbi:MAG: hypothetical protein QM704_06670 [Anaeromyxobacteraceae bacterium]
MNPRAHAYRLYHRLRGSKLMRLHGEYLAEYRAGTREDAHLQRLADVLVWARGHVPLHRERLAGTPEATIRADPVAALRSLPVLTKQVLREREDALLSDDLPRRRTYFNTSGGSTGEPVRLVQDGTYFERSMAAKYVYSSLVGRDVGEPEVVVWGSERDILDGGRGLRRRLAEWLTASRTVNAFRMTEAGMRACLADLDRRPPRLVLAYAQAIYELASFAEREGIRVRPQHAVMTSAGTLYPFMRERLERVFGCRVYNRYGSREVGDIACELPGHRGLWVSPWNAWVEVLDAKGRPAPEGVEGDIVVTSLTNFAMPLLRYAIGDRGALGAPERGSQVLARVSGRNVDTFRAADGSLVDGEYFTHLLYFRPWVKQFQIVQRSVDRVSVRVVRLAVPPASDLAEIASACRKVLGERCAVEFDWVDRIAESTSGKYRYTISEVAA